MAHFLRSKIGTLQSDSPPPKIEESKSLSGFTDIEDRVNQGIASVVAVLNNQDEASTGPFNISFFLTL